MLALSFETFRSMNKRQPSNTMHSSQPHTSSTTAMSRDMPPDTSGFASSFYKNQIRATIPPLPSTLNLQGQCAVVTGANSGLGLECCRHLLSLGLSHLIMGVRSVERGQHAAQDLQRANTQANIDVWSLEMESYQSVQDFAQECHGLARIDMAILNAGLADVTFSVVPATGHERVMQVNYWSTALLEVLLVPIMKAHKRQSWTPRITVVNSGMANFSTLPNRDKRPLLRSFDDTTLTPWDPQTRYNDSKLVGQFFLSRLVENTSPHDVIINMVEPGLTKGTQLFRNVGGLSGAVFAMLKSAAARPAHVASRTYVDAAAVKGPESHGCYISLGKIAPLAPLTYGENGRGLSDCIWEESLEEFETVCGAAALEHVRSSGT
ncbi:putative short-chain dehydrogenase/reductase family protein [Emericellopsis atlantica]|uniref:Short-chain dehydrogenase/reductase family protein n=1 Tax=Emericellopsis atlantica TaxID=2614577 RepID=A0A9P7ZMI0_9HYPO|nr:putative short-chain dehydrogenase/reductase family protein [Emericellopsis atlantica]KAG9254839.1 putative short-chain dehydrogenase/reductase family protein [Emericellopsis atlantica]